MPDAARNDSLTINPEPVSRFKAGRRLSLVGLFLIAITVAAACLAVWQLYEDRIADEESYTKNLAVVLTDQTARSFQAVDLVVRETRKMVLDAGTVDPDQFRARMGTEEVHHYLQDRLHSLPQASSIALLDNAGRIVNFSRAWPVPFIDASDRDFYAYWREHNRNGAFIGVPVINKSTGAWVIMITRRVSGPHGEFLGIVAGVIDARYLEEFYRTITPNDGESVSLFRTDGTLLARYPHVEEMIAKTISTASPWYETAAAGGGTYRTPGYIGGVPRIISTKLAQDYPLVISVGVSEAVALAPWRRQSVIIGISALCAVIGFAILFRALATQFRRVERRSAELAQSESRFRDFARTSSDWFWETDEHHRFTFMSEGLRTLGFSTEPGRVVGRTRLELAADAGSETAKWEEHLAVLQRHEPFRDFVYTWVNPGREGTASISGDPVYDAAGRFLGYRGTGRDITDLKATETRLQQTPGGSAARPAARQSRQRCMGPAIGRGDLVGGNVPDFRRRPARVYPDNRKLP